jgi:hypothetical protein
MSKFTTLITTSPVASQLIKVCLIELSRTRLAGKNENRWVCTKNIKITESDKFGFPFSSTVLEKQWAWAYRTLKISL